MKKGLAVVAVLAVVTVASADINIFFTGSSGGLGLTKPANAFIPTTGTKKDVTSGEYVVNRFPPAPTMDVEVDINTPAYIWLHFDVEPDKVTLIKLHIDLVGDFVDRAYYVVDDTMGDEEAKRWEGAYTAPVYPEFKMDPQLLWAVLANGIRNTSSPEQAWNLYNPGTRIALLGALTFDKLGGTTTAKLGTSGASTSSTGPPPKVNFGTVRWIPEPASLLLFGLGGLLIRRR